MKTVIDNLRDMADEMDGMLQTLLLKYSSIYKWNVYNGTVVVISTQGDYAYRDLQEAGRQIQAKLLEEYRRFGWLCRILLREQPNNVLEKLSEAETIMFQTIQQQYTWCETTQEALTKAIEALQTQIKLLRNLYAPATGDNFYVPDTNALLYNTSLEKWEFEGVPSFTLVITPPILSELDALKINHHNETVRQKAVALINQIKEFRRRGKLNEGVILVKGKSTLLAIATEPNMKNTLPWLDPSNNDDRFLAIVIEVMRIRPRSIVLAVSRDINFQNKAELARVPFVEPPEPIIISSNPSPTSASND